MTSSNDKDVDPELAAAFRAGIAASENYDALMGDVQAAVREFSKGLAVLTDGRVEVELRPTIVERARQISAAVASVLGPMEPVRVQANALIARGRLGATATKEYQICFVHVARDVFPVELEWSGTTVVCKSAEELRQGLRRLVLDVQVAKRFREIMVEYDAIVARRNGGSP